MRKLIGACIGLSMISSSIVLADDNSSGCGLGWEVSKKQSILSSAVRSTTHAFLPNTFSMTFGTSGCSRHQIVKNDENAVVYAVNNYDSLVIDMAKGDGEYLAGFAQTLGCSKASASRFNSLAQSQVPQIMNIAHQEGVELYRAVRGQVMADPVLSQDCVPSGAV